MNPFFNILGVDLYWMMVIIGLVAAFVLLRLLHSYAGISFDVFRFIVFVLVGAIFVGYPVAVLFQSWYAYLESGVFRWGAGATFYGGLIGGTAGFFIGYFAVGHFVFKDKKHIRELNGVVAAILPCVALAHAFGRLGCLFHGCCYGALTDSAIGIKMYVDGEWQNRVPVQLFESLFLFALVAVLSVLLVKKRCAYTHSVYLIAYGVWRFCIEYARDDARGSSGIGVLSPSQLTAIVLVLLGIALIFAYKYFLKDFLPEVGVTETPDVPAPSSAERESEETSNDVIAQPTAGEKASQEAADGDEKTEGV